MAEKKKPFYRLGGGDFRLLQSMYLTEPGRCIFRGRIGADVSHENRPGREEHVASDDRQFIEWIGLRIPSVDDHPGREIVRHVRFCGIETVSRLLLFM